MFTLFWAQDKAQISINLASNRNEEQVTPSFSVLVCSYSISIARSHTNKAMFTLTQAQEEAQDEAQVSVNLESNRYCMWSG